MANQEVKLFGSILVASLLIAVTIKFYKKDINIDLNQVDKITGIVASCGVTEKSSVVGGRLKVNGAVFYIYLDNSSQYYGTYKPSQDYTALVEKIKAGDEITIYYNERQNNELNLDVYQIEKNGEILVNYENYNSNYKKLSLLTGIMGLGILIYSIWEYYKKEK